MYYNNKATLFGAVILLAVLKVSAGVSHYPFCTEEAAHNDTSRTSNCRSYAMKKAMGSASRVNCPDLHLGAWGQISGNEWTQTGPYTISNLIYYLQPGDIVAWQDNASTHAAFFEGAQNDRGYNPDSSNTYVWHVNQEGAEDFARVTIAAASAGGRGNPTHIIRTNAIWKISVKNEFLGGTLKFDGTTRNSGYNTGNTQDWGSSHSFEATIDSSLYGGKYHSFDKWQFYASSDGTNPFTSRDFDINDSPGVSDWGILAEYTAKYLAYYITTVNNEFYGGQVTIDGDPYSAPKAYPMDELESVTVAATNQTVNAIEYYFDAWKYGSTTLTTNNTYVHVPSTNRTITAHFTGTPQKVTGVTVTSSVGQNVSFSWSAHPNSNVSYRIYRKPKYGSSTLVTTKSHGTTSFTDPLYEHTTSILGDLYYWDIRAYYATDATEADEKWYALFGKIGFKRMADGATGTPTKFALGNYPNPFNPNTTITYALPKRADVSLAIYNVMGREILVDRQMDISAGRYKMHWTARDGSGVKLPNGIYLYRLVATPTDGSATFVETRKMVLLK